MRLTELSQTCAFLMMGVNLPGESVLSCHPRHSRLQPCSLRQRRVRGTSSSRVRCASASGAAHRATASGVIPAPVVSSSCQRQGWSTNASCGVHRTSASRFLCDFSSSRVRCASASGRVHRASASGVILAPVAEYIGPAPVMDPSSLSQPFPTWHQLQPCTLRQRKWSTSRQGIVPRANASGRDRRLWLEYITPVVDYIAPAPVVEYRRASTSSGVHRASASGGVHHARASGEVHRASASGGRHLPSASGRVHRTCASGGIHRASASGGLLHRASEGVPAPMVKYSVPAPVKELANFASAPMVEYIAPAPVVEYIAPATSSWSLSHHLRALCCQFECEVFLKLADPATSGRDSGKGVSTLPVYRSDSG